MPLPLPSEVPDVYRRNRMEVSRDCFFNSLGEPDQCGCLIAVLAIDKVGSDAVKGFRTHAPYADAIGIGYRFAIGATTGFDGKPKVDIDSADYSEGYQYGVDSYQSLVDAGMVEV